MVSISTLGQSLDQIQRLKQQQLTFADLTAQVASGKKTQQLSGLGNDIIKTVRSRAGINSLETYIDNIKNADRRLKLMQTSINEVKAQVGTIADTLVGGLQEGDYPDLSFIKQLASNVEEFIIGAINSKDGERYLFAGGDTSEAPITNTGLYSSFLGTFIPDVTDITNPPITASGVIGDWGDGTLTTDQFIASYKTVNETVLGFSNALTSGTAGKTTVRVNDNAEFDYTTLANDTPMKQIIMVLGILKNLPPVEHAPGALNDPTATSLAQDTPPFPPAEKQENYFRVINDLRVTLNKALKDMDQESFRLSQVQAQITKVKDSHSEQISAYTDIVADSENADITEVSALILQMQTQLQASFQVTSMAAQLTLVNFLG